MDKLNRIVINGKEYVLAADGGEVVKELDGLGDGSKDIIFVGLLDERDKDKPICYSYLNKLLNEDSVNNKVFANTNLPISIRYKWEEAEFGKTFLIVMPENHPNLYSLSNSCQCFNGWEDEDAVEVLLDFPTGVKRYKAFIFCNFLYRFNSEITYKF